MNFLARDTFPFPQDFWDNIDKTVVDTVRKNLVGRKFLTIFGPLGAGTISVQIDDISSVEEIAEGAVRTSGRTLIEVPQIFEDFILRWRDIENSEMTGAPVDLSRAIVAAQAMARKEDSLIFFGNEFIGYEGLLNALGTMKMKRGDWSTGENAFSDIAKGLSSFESKGIIGRCALIVSPDLFVQLQRIQPALGMMEAERIRQMLGGSLFIAPVLGKDKAVLVCAEPQYMDLAVGKDMETGYLEPKDFNHVFRIIETAALRIKCRDAIIVYE